MECFKKYDKLIDKKSIYLRKNYVETGLITRRKYNVLSKQLMIRSASFEYPLGNARKFEAKLKLQSSLN